jgi:S-(hydroxymethyl)glutathione dehydrogenase/alcohol dehydrogenase
LANPPVRFDRRLAGETEIDPMSAHTPTLGEISEGFDLMHGGRSIRSVMVC